MVDIKGKTTSTYQSIPDVSRDTLLSVAQIIGVPTAEAELAFYKAGTQGFVKATVCEYRNNFVC